MNIKFFTLNLVLSISCVFCSYAQDNAIVKYNNGVESYEAGRYNEAISQFNQAIAARYDNPEEVHAYRANAKYQLEDYLGAMFDYTSVIAFNNSNSVAYNNRGLAKYHLKRYHDAIEDYNSALQLQPDYAAAFNNRANAKRAIHQFDQALKDYNKALGLNQKDPVMFNNRGVVKDDLGSFREAIIDYTKAINLDPTYAEAYNNRGYTFFKLDDYQSAVNDFDTAIELDASYWMAIDRRTEAIKALQDQNVQIYDVPKAKKDFVSVKEPQLIWIYPNPDEFIDNVYPAIESQIEIKLKVIGTSEKVSEDDFMVLYDRVSSKFNEVTLHKGKKSGDKHSYTFTSKINLKEGNNLVGVELNMGEKSFRSEILNIDYNGLKPNLHLIAVGTKTNLRYTANDAQDFANLFNAQSKGTGRLYNRVKTTVLLNENANAHKIVGELEQLKIMHETENLRPNDMVILHFSSHGFVHNDRFYLQGSDYQPGKIRSTAVDYNEMVAILDEIPCKKLLLIDACHSGAADAKTDVDQIIYEIKKLNNTRPGLTTIVSSSENEFSYEDPQWQNGAFTEAIVGALKYGVGDTNKDGIVTIDELFGYINKRVPFIVKNQKSKPQTPQIISNDLGNVAIYVVK